MLSTLISATVGVVSLYAGGIWNRRGCSPRWRAWWIGDMVGVLLIAPIILVWSTAPRARREVHPLETVALVAVLRRQRTDLPQRAATHSGTRDAISSSGPARRRSARGAIRFGQRGATTAVLCVSVAAIVATSLRYGPFVLGELNVRLMLLQTFMAIVAATCLLFGASIAERRIANQESV